MNKVRGDTKTASQAWRKKPRKFAPKSRRGCKTCKIRRVKCDEARPWCMKCQSTGRTCDGYDADPRFVEAEVKTSQPHHTGTVAAANSSLFGACVTINTQRAPSPCRQSQHSLTLQNLRPFMMLSAIAPEAMSFFELISVRHLNEYHPSESWRKTLMFFAQTVPSVRHAAVALALVHRNYHDGCVTTLSEQKPLIHYNRAIQLLLAHRSGDGAEKLAITLLVCYLFTSFDSLAGNYIQAMTHLQGGVELSRNIPKAMLSESSASNGNILSGSRVLLTHVTRQIRRLDMQAVAFLVGWTPADIQETTGDDSLLSSEGAFESLNQAADSLQVLIAQTMRLQWVAQEASFADGVPSRAAKELLIGQLETWSRRFEEMLALRSSHHATADTGSYRLSLLSRLQHTILRILVSGLGPGREMEYDRFLPAFRQCVAMADTVTAAHQRYAGSSKPAFTPEVAILPVLYIIGAKCRDPAVRREVVRILRRQPLREAVWDSVFAARAVERIAEIEESRAGGARAESMDDIAVWQRIECVSWGQVVGGPSAAARMELEYTFCRQEGKHRESVVI